MIQVRNICLQVGQFASRKGVVDLIVKPFPTEGRTLDRVIKKVLGIANGMPRSNGIQTDDNGDDAEEWLTVTQAAELLMHDVPGLSMAKASSRISTAAGRKEFKFAGVRQDRGIEPNSFASWRLKQRDRDLDDEDDLTK